MRIGVLGPGREATRDEEALAEEVGRELATRAEKPTLVCGGGDGVMRAAARGCYSSGGVTVGLLPGASSEGANSHLTVELPTGLGELRNWLIVNACDAFICIGGSWGTLSEVALAVRSGKRCFGLSSWGVVDQHGAVLAGIEIVGTPREAVRSAIAAADDSVLPRRSPSDGTTSREGP